MNSPSVLALLQWGLANLFLLGTAASLGGALRLHRRSLDLLVIGFLWVFLATLMTLAFGLAGALAPLPMTVASVLGLLGLGALWYRGILRPARATRSARRLGLPRRPADRLLTALCLVLLAGQAVRMAVHVWLLPPYIIDVLVYHLPNVAEWIQAERITTFDTPVTRTWWPANFALLQAWFAVFPRHDFLIDAAGIPYYALAVGSVYSLCRSLRLRRALALFAATAFAYTPAVALHATSGNNDLPIAAAFLFLTALLADTRRRGGALARRSVIAWLVLCLAMGTKPYILFAAPGLAVLTLWAWRGRSALRRPEAAVGVPLLGAALVSGALVGGFWFVRNWIEFGNPFHPTDLRLFGELVFGSGAGKSQQGTFSLTGLGQNLEALFGKKIFDDHWPFHADLAYMTGWGWFAFACGAPTLLWGLAARPVLRWLAAGFILALLGVLACVTPDAWNMRFGLWFPALFAVTFTALVQRLRSAPPLRAALLLFATFCLLLNLTGTLNVGLLEPANWQRLAELPVAERSAAKLTLYTGPSFGTALRTIPTGETIGFHNRGDGPVYPLYDADFSRALRFVPITAESDVVAAMAERGVRYLAVYKPFRGAQRRIAEHVAAGELQVLREFRTQENTLSAGIYVTP